MIYFYVAGYQFEVKFDAVVRVVKGAVERLWLLFV